MPIILIIIIYIASEPDSENTSSNLYDKDLTWPEIEDIWRKTINFRLNFIKENNAVEIFKKWNHYTMPMGYKLVRFQIEFNKLI